LRLGSVADIAVLDLKQAESQFADTFGHERTGMERLTARHTIRGGVVWGSPSHPGVGVGVLDE